jgi:hypothetical protein
MSARKPDFVVIGSMKSATSTVCAFLEDHRDCYMVPRAEPNFFSRDENWAKGEEWYRAFFEAWGAEKIGGEGSNGYAAGSMFPHSAERMHGYRPDLKLIYMVRHPIDRLVSTWIQSRADHGDDFDPSLDKAILKMPDDFTDQSLYWKNLSRYRAYFPDENIFIGFMEELEKDRVAFFTGLCTFLGISTEFEVKRPRANISQGKAVPSYAFTLINRLPLIGVAKALIPAAFKKWVKANLFSRKINEKPKIGDKVYRQIIGEIRADSEQFLAHCGKPRDYWSL